MRTTTMTALLLAALSAPALAAAPSAEKFYAGKCASCHGKDGRGNAKMLAMFKVEAKDLDLLDVPSSKEADAAALKSILEGKGKKMPAFKAKLDGLDAGELLKYVYGLAQAAGKP